MKMSKKHYEHAQEIGIGTLPAIPGIHQQEGFLLAIPEAFIATAADGVCYCIQVDEVMSREVCVYNLLTTVENYEHTLAQFVNSDISKLNPSVTVLVTYFDEELGLYSSLSLCVNLTRIVDDEDNLFEPQDTERIVMAFRDFLFFQQTGKYRLE